MKSEEVVPHIQTADAIEAQHSDSLRRKVLTKSSDRKWSQQTPSSGSENKNPNRWCDADEGILIWLDTFLVEWKMHDS